MTTSIIVSIVGILATTILTVVGLALYVKRKLPVILEDVGLSVQEQIVTAIKELMRDPMVKRSMSVLGKQSGVVRADSALVDRVADNLLDGQPMIKMWIEKLGISPTEALSLWNDPTLGPIIQGLINQGLDPKKLLGSGGSDSNSVNRSSFGFGE